MPEDQAVAPVSEEVQIPESYKDFEKYRNTGKMPETPAPTVKEGETAEGTELSQEEQDKQDRDDKGRFKPKESEVPAGVQKRIDKVTAKWREAERERDELRAKLEQSQAAKPAEPQKVADSELKPEDFPTYEKYVKALAAQEAEAKLAAFQQKTHETQSQQKATEQQQAIQADYQKSESAVRAKYPDYDEVLEEASDAVKLPDHVGIAILLSDAKAELAYYLAKDRAELERIAQVPPYRIGYELGKLEAKLTPAQVTTRTTNAPAPPSPVGARAGTSSFDPTADQPFRDFERGRNAQIRAER